MSRDPDLWGWGRRFEQIAKRIIRFDWEDREVGGFARGEGADLVLQAESFGGTDRDHLPKVFDWEIRGDLVHKAEVFERIEICGAGTTIGADREVDSGGEHVAEAVGRVAEIRVRA